MLVTLPVIELALDKKDDTPLAGDVGALVVLLAFRLNDIDGFGSVVDDDGGGGGGGHGPAGG